MRHYRICGYEVVSTFALPGAIDVAPFAGAPDVRVCRGTVPPALDAPKACGPNWSMTADGFVLLVPGVVRFLIAGGREIVMDLEPGVDEGDGCAFLLGAAFGILLHQRGRLALRASAVRIGGEAVLFCGRSGAGKSTLAAALEAKGHPCIVDDLCCVTFGDDGQPGIAPDGKMLQLWIDSVEGLDLSARKGPAVRAGIGKFYVAATAPASPAALPIAAIYVLRESRPPFQSGIETENAVETALLLRRNTHRPWLVETMGLTRECFRATLAVQRRVALFRLTRPLDFTGTAGVVAQLEAHWRTLGLGRMSP